MLSKHTRVALVGVLAALHSASAQEAPPEAGEVQQLPTDLQELANEKCHQGGTYKLGDESSVIPPCVAEQLIFTECEGRAGFIDTEGVRMPPGKQNMDIYKQCVLGGGSTLQADRDGCLACKKSNEIFSGDEVEFWSKIYGEAAAKLAESNDTKTLPELYEELRLQSDKFPQPLQENNNVTVPLQEYYPNPPKPQRAGDSEAVEEQDVANEQGQGAPVKRQVTVQAQLAAFASASFGCQRPGFGFFTPAMVQKQQQQQQQQQKKKQVQSSTSSVSSAVPTTLVKAVPSAAAAANITGATNLTASTGATNLTTPNGRQTMNMMFVFVMAFTPSQHVMKRQQDGSYTYVITFGKPAPIADSPETPQKPLSSREEGEKRGLPNISQCRECAKEQVTLPGVVQAEAAQPNTRPADNASNQVLEKVESAAQQNGGQQPPTMVFVVNIGVTAGASVGPPGAETPGSGAANTTTSTTNSAGEVAADRPVRNQGDGQGQAKAPSGQAKAPSGQPGPPPPRSTQTAAGTPQTTRPSGNSC